MLENKRSREKSDKAPEEDATLCVVDRSISSCVVHKLLQTVHLRLLHTGDNSACFLLFITFDG